MASDCLKVCLNNNISGIGWGAGFHQHAHNLLLQVAMGSSSTLPQTRILAIKALVASHKHLPAGLTQPRPDAPSCLQVNSACLPALPGSPHIPTHHFANSSSESHELGEDNIPWLTEEICGSQTLN